MGRKGRRTGPRQVSAPPLFSSKVRHLRLAWDATALAALMRDPLTYYWKYCLGYRPPGTSVVLEWGTAWHEAVAVLHEAWWSGLDRDVALRLALNHALQHARAVGLDALAASGRDKDRKIRNTFTLLRALVWYDEEWTSPYKTRVNSAGLPAIEHKFCLPLLDENGSQLHAVTGEGYWLTGSFDQVVEDELGRTWLLERKTTDNTIGAGFWGKYDPSPQINTYAAVGTRELGPGVSGVMIEALQTAVGFARFARREVARSPACHDAWMATVRWWVRLGERLALDNSWKAAVNLAYPYHDTAFKRIFAAPAALWDDLLTVHCERGEVWNPLTK